jgi:hypothetical protein
MAEHETTPEQPENPVLVYLRRIDTRMDGVALKLDKVIVRFGRLEREVVGLHGDFAGLSVRLDNLDRRVGRIERRLELIGDPAPTGAV